MDIFSNVQLVIKKKKKAFYTCSKQQFKAMTNIFFFFFGEGSSMLSVIKQQALIKLLWMVISSILRPSNHFQPFCLFSCPMSIPNLLSFLFFKWKAMN